MRLYSRLVQRIVDAEHVDVVISPPCINLPARCQRILNMDDDHAAYWREFRQYPVFAEEIERRTKRWAEEANRIVTVGRILATHLSALCPQNAERIVVIPNSVDRSLFQARDTREARAQLHLPQETPIITLVSVLGEFSGVDLFVRAANLLRAENLAFVVIGDGVLRLPAMARAQELQLQNIRFLGQVPYGEIPRYLAASSIGVVAKPKSAFTDAACSLKAIEYSAAGLPVVATDLREMRAMNFPNVLLVQDTAEGIAEGIRKVLSWTRVPAVDLSPYDIETVGRAFERLIHEVGGGR